MSSNSSSNSMRSVVRNLHIFDFDGTLFRSPVPHKDRIIAKYGPAAYDEVVASRCANGYGWFESPRTLSEPALPAIEHLTSATDDVTLSPDVHQLFDKHGVKCTSLFVEQNVATLRALQQQASLGGGASPSANNNNSTAAATSSSLQVSNSFQSPRVFVMSGRHESLRTHIAKILNARKLLSPGGLILKESLSLGTVKYKVHALFKMYVDALFDFSRARMLPISTMYTGIVSVAYYEDRKDQGTRIEAAMLFIQWLLTPSIGSRVLTFSADYKTGIRTGAGSIDLTQGDALLAAGCPETVVTVVPPHHCLSYAEHVNKKLGKLYQVRSRAPPGVQASAEVEKFLKILPSIVFELHMVPEEWGSDSFLSAEMEDKLLEEMEKELFA